jgi:hypothetical protein
MDNIRQGDVLLRPVAKIPDLATKIPVNEQEGIVLARGEGHGHLHRLPFGGAYLYLSNDQGHRFVEVASDTKLEHVGSDGEPTGDHATLDVPVGKYEVIQQRQAEGEFAVYRED